MARKPILEGGKREEIIQKAMQLFFLNGYESTSIRMILEQVNGEVGMFYHYFKSKEELFDQVVAYFFQRYQTHFIATVQECKDRDQLIEKILLLYKEGMQQYHTFSEKLHWTIQSAMATKTIQSFLPVIMEFIQKTGYSRKCPIDLVAGQLLYSISATLHNTNFGEMQEKEQKMILMELFQRVLDE